MPPPRRTPPWGYAVLAGYLLAMAVLVLWPDGLAVGRVNVLAHDVLQRAGMPAPMTPARWEIVFNVLVCIPPTVLAMVLWPRSRWWWWAALGAGLSLTVELVQWRYLPARSPDLSDIAANTTGAVLGALIGEALRTRL